MKKGDSVYIVYDDSRMRPHRATILSIGSKYIYVSEMHPSQSRFDILTHKSVDTSSGYNIRATLYSSEADYRLLQERNAREKALREKVISWARHADMLLLETVINIVGI